MRSILLKFSGPLQSWGTDSHFETRETDLYPSKSGVIGLVAACLGYGRDEDENISSLNSLSFAVRIDRPGLLLHDYQIARKYKANGEQEQIYVTNRYYLEDAIFLVVLSHENNAMIDEIEEALRFPYFTPSLGRRSVPIPAEFILAKLDQDALSLLHDYPWQGDEKGGRYTPTKLTIYSDSDLMSDDNPSRLRRDLVLSFSYKERQYGFRSESRGEMRLAPQSATEEHDAFAALED